MSKYPVDEYGMSYPALAVIDFHVLSPTRNFDESAVPLPNAEVGIAAVVVPTREVANLLEAFGAKLAVVTIPSGISDDATISFPSVDILRNL
jgi:hypothetical protein